MTTPNCSTKKWRKMADKKSFVFYHKWKELLEDLSADDVKDVVFALIDYSESNEIPKTLSPVANQAFKAFRQTIDEDTQKWESTCKRNAENGKNGGRPQKPKKPSGFSGLSEKPKKPDNDNEYDNDYDYELTPPTPSKGADSAETVCQSQGESLTVLKTAGGIKSHSTTLDEDFNRFWQAYPKKADKQKALKAWQKLKPDEKTLNDMLEAIERHKQSDEQWHRNNGQYIPLPSTWLNGRRWEDECVVDLAVEKANNYNDFDPENPYKDWR